MKTIGLDTNSVLSYFLSREPHFKQIKKVFENCLEGKVKIFIPDIVFLECEWALRSIYKQSKLLIIKFFQELLQLDNIIIQKRQDLELALDLYKNSSGISFTDCVILRQIQNFNPHEFLTFDKNLEKVYRETAS